MDDLRLHGRPVVPLSYAQIKTALIDKNSRNVLFELQQQYSGQINLFLSTNALMDRRLFFGREGLITQVGGAIERGEHSLITGLRKSGKSSYLNILRQHLPDHPWCRVDLQLLDAADPKWPLFVFQSIVNAVDRWGRANWGDWPQESPKVESGVQLAEVLADRRAQQRSRGRGEPLVLVLDEIERVPPPLSPPLIPAPRLRLADNLSNSPPQ